MNRAATFFVRIFQRFVPDPYIFAVLLTLLTALLALAFAPHRGIDALLGGWYAGIFDIFEFALQMILILVTGYALADSAPVLRGLDRLAAVPQTPKAAVTLTFLVSAAACWLNWGFGLVVAGLLARAIGTRMRVDFGWLVAAAYSGFLVWASGLSSSIALAQTTPGNKLNLVQQLAGTVLPLTTTIFTAFNLVPVLVTVILVALLLRSLAPADPQPAVVRAHDDATGTDARLSAALEGSPAYRLERAWPLNAVLVLAGAIWLIHAWSAAGWNIAAVLDIKSVIFILLLLGLALHGKPIRYVQAVDRAARVTGPLLLQYPLYGGIMGIMKATGLAGVIAAWFVTFSTAATLPFWSYVSSVVISLFVPSGGGHWAVQGPFVVPAAVHLHASLGASAMGVAMGEQVANMLQPFWALPVLAIAGVGLQRVMGYTVLSFCVAFAVFALALLLLVPH